MDENTVRIRIEVDSAVQSAAMKPLEGQLKQIVALANQVGVSLGNIQLKEIGTMGSASRRQLIDDLTRIAENADRAAAAQDRLARGLGGTRGQTPLGGPFNVGSRAVSGQTSKRAQITLDILRNIRDNEQYNSPATARAGAFAAGPAGVRRQTDTSMANVSLLNRWNAAAREAEAGTYGLDRSLGKARGSMEGLRGATYIGTQALHEFGIPGARAVEVLANQFLNMGLSLNKFLENPLTKFTAGIIVFAAAAEYVEMFTSALRQSNEAVLAIATSQAKITFAGQEGTFGQRESALKTLQEQEQSARFLAASGQYDEAALLRAQSLGGAGSKEEITRAQTALMSKNRTFLQSFEDAVTLGATQNARNDAARADLEAKRGGIITPEMMKQRIEEVGRATIAFQKSLIGTGQKNIFDEASDSLTKMQSSLERETRTFASGLSPELQGTVLGDLSSRGLDKAGVQKALAAMQNAKTPQEVENAQRLLKEKMDSFRETMAGFRSTDEQIKKQFADQNKRLDLEAEGRKTIDTLRSELTDNPIEKVFLGGRAKLEELYKRFKDLPTELRDPVIAAAKELESLNIFKAFFNFDKGQRDLRREAARLESGIGTDTEGIAERQRQAVAEAQIRQARETGDYAMLTEGQAALYGRDYGLAQQAANARARGDYVGATNLQNQSEDATRQENERRFNRRFREAEFDDLSKALNTAKDPSQRTFVLDQILSATSDIGALNSTQRDFRARALQERLRLGEGERHRVLIEIKQDAALRDSVRSSLEEQGQEPSPDVIGSQPSPFDPLQGSY